MVNVFGGVGKIEKSEKPKKMKNFLLAEHQEFFDSEQPWSEATSTLAEYRRIQNR